MLTQLIACEIANESNAVLKGHTCVYVCLLPLWKHNAVTTMVTPCKYVSPRMRSLGHVEGNETGGSNSMVKEESEEQGTDRQHIKFPTFHQWKAHKQEKQRLQIFWLSGSMNVRDTVWCYLCLSVFEFRLSNFLLGPCFLTNSIIFVSVSAHVFVHAKSNLGKDITVLAVLQLNNVSICFLHWKHIERLQVATMSTFWWLWASNSLCTLCLCLCVCTCFCQG